MKLCDTCIYRNEDEYHKPCIVYRDDCEYYEKERGDMTREEAIKELQESHDIMRSYDIDESESRLMTALDMAIKALEQEPCEDYISRQAVFDAIEELKKIHFDRVVVLNKVRDRVLDLPPVNPQEPKTGHWESTELFYEGKSRGSIIKCSECGNEFKVSPKVFERLYDNERFCNHCGCRMVEPQERSE